MQIVEYTSHPQQQQILIFRTEQMIPPAVQRAEEELVMNIARRQAN